MKIKSDFDGGNATLLDISDDNIVDLAITADAGTDYRQWFCFDLLDARGQDCRLNIVNAGAAAFPKGWENYRVCVSDEPDKWSRIDTKFDGATLNFDYRPSTDCVRFAYFPPFDLDRHKALIDRSLKSRFANLEILGQTLDGRNIDCLRIGELDPNRPTCWFVARQHPGETMAEWWIDGLLLRLLQEDDAISIELRRNANIFVVPNMNLDGSFRGHIRTNAVGMDLNRAWSEPSREKTPEVFYVRERMKSTGVDFCLDVHGDEALPYVFLTSGYGIPSMSELQIELRQLYSDAMLKCSEEFQTEFGYPKAGNGKANLTICANYLAETFKGVSFTLEQPFKDNEKAPNPDVGWSPDRAMKMGADSLQALSVLVPELDRLRERSQ